MKKYIDEISYLFFCFIVILLLAILYYLTQKNYTLLRQSNTAVVRTGKLINIHQKLSADFKNLIIYTPDFKGTSKKYPGRYQQGISHINDDLQKLKGLVDSNEQLKLDSLSREIGVQANWMMSKDIVDTLLYGQRNEHVRSIISIQDFIDNEPRRLEQISLYQVRRSEQSLITLHTWLAILIICSSITVTIMMTLIFFQIKKVKDQNKSLMEIAWIQSHRVRAQVATILGLGQLFNHHDSSDPENEKIIVGIVDSTEKLDKIVKEINEKTIS